MASKKTHEVVIQTPSKIETFNKYMNIYKDKLTNMSIQALSERHGLSRRVILRVIRWATQYNDMGSTNKEAMQIAKDKAILRIDELRKEIKEIKVAGRVLISTVDKYRIALQYQKEIRANEELICKVDGLLKIDLNQYIDKRSVTIIHNMEKETSKKEMVLDDSQFKL